jgi:hypothetical protein
MYILAHYRVFWSREPAWFFNGADQLLLYGSHYSQPAILLFVFASACLLGDVFRRLRASEPLAPYVLPAQLYGLALLVVLLLPSVVQLPGYSSPAGFLTERLSAISAMMACCLLAVIKPRKWHLAGFAAPACVFFFCLYADTARIARMETQAARLQRTLPPGSRVIATIPRSSGSRVFTHHIVDRACIGHCFSFGNYEPASGAFRIRARPGNGYATASFDDALAIERGRYLVRPQDLPLFQISPCAHSHSELCIRPLVAGELNGQSHGLRPSGGSIMVRAN